MLIAPTRIALAQTAAKNSEGEPEASPLSINVSATTDYRYRGISQTRLKPALQAGADWAFASGFYLGTWASTIRWIQDSERAAGVDARGSVEWDLYGGYKGVLATSVGYDVGVLSYVYPGNRYGDIPGSVNANTTELYGALNLGPATLKYAHALTRLFGFADSRHSDYLDLSATFDVGHGIQLIPHVGHQRVRHNNDFSYTDYALSVTKDIAGFVVSGSFVGSNTQSINGARAYASPADGRNLGRSGFVVGVRKNF